jgi:hypothetical protein
VIAFSIAASTALSVARVGPNGGPKQGYSGSRSRHSHGRPIVPRRAEREFSRRRPLGCVHSMICDVEALPKTSNARRALTCTRPRFRAGLAGLRAKLRSLSAVMEARATTFIALSHPDKRSPWCSHRRHRILASRALMESRFLFAGYAWQFSCRRE